MSITPEEARALLAQAEEQEATPERSVGNIARATGQRLHDTALGAASGAVAVVGTADVLLRQLGESIGALKEGSAASSRVRTNRLRENMKEGAYNRTQADVGDAATQLAAYAVPGTAIGKSATAAASRGLGLLGATGKAASVAANAAGGAASGAAVGGFMDPGEDGSRLKNTVQGGLLGGAVGGALGLRAGTNPESVRAFERAQVKPLLSQVVESPTTQSGARAVQNSLNQIPVLGVRGAVRRQHRAADKFVKRIVNELDNSVDEGADITERYSQLFNQLDQKGKYQFTQTARSANEVQATLNNLGAAFKPSATQQKTLDLLVQKQPISAGEAHLHRKLLDDVLGTLKSKTKPSTVSKEQFRILSEARKTAESELEKVVGRAGAGKTYKNLKGDFQKRAARDILSAEVEKATKHELVNLPKLADRLETLKGNKLIANDAEVRSAINGLRKIGDKMAQSKLTPKEGIGAFDLMNVGIGGTAAGVAGVAGAGTQAGGLALLNYALTKLVSTKTGLSLISDIGRHGLTNGSFNTVLEALPTIAGALLTQEGAPEEATITPEQARQLLEQDNGNR